MERIKQLRERIKELCSEKRKLNANIDDEINFLSFQIKEIESENLLKKCGVELGKSYVFELGRKTYNGLVTAADGGYLTVSLIKKDGTVGRSVKHIYKSQIKSVKLYEN